MKTAQKLMDPAYYHVALTASEAIGGLAWDITCEQAVKNGETELVFCDAGFLSASGTTPRKWVASLLAQIAESIA